MTGYFIKLFSLKRSFLILCNYIVIKKSDNCIYFMFNDLCISVIDIKDIESIYHYKHENKEKIFDFENVPFPEVI